LIFTGKNLTSVVLKDYQEMSGIEEVDFLTIISISVISIFIFCKNLILKPLLEKNSDHLVLNALIG